MERKTEFMLTLIGAILSGLFSLLMIGITFLIGIGISATSYTASDDYYYDSYNYSDSLSASEASIIIGAFAVISAIFIATAIFGFIAAFKVKKDSRGWGIAVFICGILSISTLHGILWLIAGIMMLARKTPKQEPMTSHTLKEDMEKLSSLHDQGVLSDEEYEAKKNEWLDF